MSVGQFNFTCLVVMLNEEIFGLDVFCLLGARNTTIFFTGKSAHAVLENNISGYPVALCIKEMMCPKDNTQFIIHSDKFGFRGTFSVEFVFVLMNW